MREYHLDLNNPEFVNDPYPLLAELRETVPIFVDPVWNKVFFTRYDDIATLLRDGRLGRSMLHALSRNELGYTDEQAKTANQAVVEFFAYIKNLARQRQQQPRNDLISALVRVEEQGQVLTVEELVANCILLLNAGHEATVNGTTLGMLSLHHHPDQMALAREAAQQNDLEFFKTAIEELLRYDTPLPMFERWVLQDFDFKGWRLQQGMR